jgi:phytoene/squalene synthetase
MIAAEVMGAVYWRLLERVEAGGFEVLGDRVVRLSKREKMYLIWRTWYRVAVASKVPNYGTR